MTTPKRPARPARPARPTAKAATLPVTSPGPPSAASPPTAASLRLGPALQRTDAELDALAEVTADDISYARSLWQRHAPPGYEALLDAEEGT